MGGVGLFEMCEALLNPKVDISQGMCDRVTAQLRKALLESRDLDSVRERVRIVATLVFVDIIVTMSIGGGVGAGSAGAQWPCIA